MTVFIFERAEKKFWKRKKCWLPTFSPFPTVFLKAFRVRVTQVTCKVQRTNEKIPLG